jgi:hypothetical protein
MKIRVHDGSDLPGLRAFLKAHEYIAEQIGPNTVEVSRLSSTRSDLMVAELELHLQAWHAAHPEARAELIE